MTPSDLPVLDELGLEFSKASRHPGPSSADEARGTAYPTAADGCRGTAGHGDRNRDAGRRGRRTVPRRARVCRYSVTQG